MILQYCKKKEANLFWTNDGTRVGDLESLDDDNKKIKKYQFDYYIKP
jgi:hypothetical protein